MVKTSPRHIVCIRHRDLDFPGAQVYLVGVPSGRPMTDSVLVSEALPSRKHASAWYAFLALLAGVTLLPLIFVPVVAQAVPDGSPTLYVYGLIIFRNSNFHVASTDGSSPIRRCGAISAHAPSGT